MQRDQTLPLSAKGMACETSVLCTREREEKLRFGSWGEGFKIEVMFEGPEIRFEGEGDKFRMPRLLQQCSNAI